MVTEVQSWGLKPCWTTGDSWYSSVGNLKFLREEKVSFLFGVAENRKVSLIQGTEVQIQTLEIPEAGLMVYLKEFSWVKVFSQDFENQVRYYIIWKPEFEALQKLNRSMFKIIHDLHWLIESFHRVIKQVCNIERFHIRNEQGIRNHFFCALSAFIKLQTMKVQGLIENLYQISRELFVPIVRQFILDNTQKDCSV